MKIVLVEYKCKLGKREDYLKAIQTRGIDTASRAEEGCLKYEYSYHISDPDVLILTEIWTGEEAVKIHSESKHFMDLGALKAEFVEETKIQRYQATEI